MKILIAMMSHETNTFSPVPTPLTRFGGGETPLEGHDIQHQYQNLGLPISGMLAVAQNNGLEIVTPIAANAPPSGPVEDSAYQYMTDLICSEASGCDGLLLDLHGAMVTQSLEDGEGSLLKRLRELYPKIPIGVSLDMHANLYPEIVENATVICGFQTYPHIDMYETGTRVATALIRVMQGEVKATTVWGNRPMLPHVMRQGTDDFPNQALQKRVHEMEQDDAICVSLFTGFPHADIKNAGLSVVVTTNDDTHKATELREELLNQAWSDKQAFIYQPTPLSESVAEAIDASELPGPGPIILLDHYDNTASGGTMDTTEVLKEIIEQGLTDVAAFGIFDPDAVETMIAAGIGEQITIELGAKIHMPALEQQSQPLRVTGHIQTISDGNFIVTGPMSTGARMRMGKTVVLNTGSVQIVVISRHIEPFDLACFKSLGIDPTAKKFLMLKSRIHYRAAFKSIAKQTIECAGIGVCTSDYSQLTFQNVRRPIFPLDGINSDDYAEGFPD